MADLRCLRLCWQCCFFELSLGPLLARMALRASTTSSHTSSIPYASRWIDRLSGEGTSAERLLLAAAAARSEADHRSPHARCAAALPPSPASPSSPAPIEASRVRSCSFLLTTLNSGRCPSRGGRGNASLEKFHGGCDADAAYNFVLLNADRRAAPATNPRFDRRDAQAAVEGRRHDNSEAIW